MLFDSEKKKAAFLTVFVLLMTSGLASAQDEIVDLMFGQPPVSDSD
jgi:hypothetical protein